MESILNLIYFIVVLSIIVIVHELGHLIAAKKFGVYCKEFSIGMGPLIWQKKTSETAYSIRAIPLGGFVSMAGEEEEEDEAILALPPERFLNGIARWKQIIVMGAGAFMNIILALFIFIGISAYQGTAVVDCAPIIVEINQDSAAMEAGFQIDDQIIRMELNNEVIDIKKYDDFTSYFDKHRDEMITYTVIRDGKEVEIDAKAKADDSGTYVLGITSNTSELIEISPLESIVYGTKQTISSMSAIFDSLSMLIRGIGVDQLSGPVGIFQVTAEVAQAGLLPILSLVALLSVNVGIMNLLPIPILDGGRIVILIIEAIIGRKLNQKVETIIMYIGLLLIVGLMLFATWNDISRIFFG